MRNLELALRTPGQVLLLERGAAQALVDRALEGRPAAPAGRSLLQKAVSAVSRLGRPQASDDYDDDVGMPIVDRSRLALPQISWAGTIEYGEGYAIVENVAILDIAGILSPDGYFDWWDWCWVGGYAQIGAAIRAARADDRVDAILLRIDSPGGYVDGCFDLADEIAAENGGAGGKPIWTHARMACSAAYALASATDRIVTPAEADVGSIGVLVMHYDVSGFYAEHGIQVEAIQSLPRKTDGAEWKPLSDDARAHLQAVVDQVARRFTKTVEAGREISAESIAAMQARWFLAQHDDAGQSGLALGLVDEIGTERAAFAALTQSLTNSTGGAPAGPGSSAQRADPTTQAETDMSLKDQIAALRGKAAKGDAKAIAELKSMGVPVKAEGQDDEEDDKEKVEGEEAPADEEKDKEEDEEDDDKEPAASATGTKAGFALLNHKEAKARPGMAAKLAKKVAGGKLSYGEAVDLLASAPKASRLADAMAGKDRNPGNDGGQNRAEGNLGGAVDRLLAKQGRKAIG